jgi:carbon-monoxide dehydrogenase medium subunit
MLPEFDMMTPKTMNEALGQLAVGEAEPVGGGTNAVVDLRSRRHVPKALVDVSRLSELKGIRREDGYVVAGGGVTVAELLASSLIRKCAPPIVEAARLFANPLVRNRATLAGNLADASPAADMAPPLLALDAEVELVSLHDCRRVPLAEFFTGVRKTVRRADELLSAVRWPAPGPAAKFGYTKLGLRQADAISVISVAVRLDVDPDGRCRAARIAMGAVAPTPLRALAAEAFLTGKPLDPQTIAEAARLAGEATQPISDLRATAAYRRRVAEVLVRRLLAQAHPVEA